MRAMVPAAPGRRDLDFLPAALELQERPPSPLGRAVAWAIMLLVAAGLAWAWAGRLDIVAVADGQTLPSLRSKVVQPLERALVRVIHVTEGQRVMAGEPLVTLDATRSAADEAALAARHGAARLEAARLRALLAGGLLAAPSDLPASAVEAARAHLADARAARAARGRALERAVARRAADLRATRAELGRLERTLPLLAERAEALEGILDEGYASRLEYLEAEERRRSAQGERAALRHRLAAAEAALEEARAERDRALRARAEADRAALAEQEAALRVLEQELVKAASRRGLHRLTAPVDGRVQELAVHTVGGVVTPAQALMTVVPARDPLEVEAWLANRDVGFVREGQAVEVKLEAFPFTRYGTIPGEVRSISDQAVEVEGRGRLYVARVGLARAAMEVDGRAVPLSPGMNVTVEIHTGSRRVIALLLGPLLEGLREAGRER